MEYKAETFEGSDIAPNTANERIYFRKMIANKWELVSVIFQEKIEVSYNKITNSIVNKITYYWKK